MRFCDAWLATPLRLDDLELPVPACGKVSSIQPWTARADVVTHALDSHPSPSRSSASPALPDLLPRPRRRGRGRQLAAKHARKVSLFFSPEWCHDALADPLLGCPTLQVLALGKCHLSDARASAVAAAALTELTLLVLLGVWHYKQVDEITVEDAPCLERLLGNMRLNAAITVTGAPKLTAFGYAVVTIPHLFHGERAPSQARRTWRRSGADEYYTTVSDYIQQRYPIRAHVLQFMRIQSKIAPCGKQEPARVHRQRNDASAASRTGAPRFGAAQQEEGGQRNDASAASCTGTPCFGAA
uniref:F-box/LRR-repeat protein 15/At3g58940/PEG3-like LRR domain-containing protein n=1 Tax=Hordeum vulgare subsp. vulgare TaxID=112509 RepID=A0A8I6XWF1_HORVV